MKLHVAAHSYALLHVKTNPYNNDCIDGAQTVVQVKQNKQTKTLGNKMLESDYTRKKNDIALTRSCLISQLKQLSVKY